MFFFKYFISILENETFGIIDCINDHDNIDLFATEIIYFVDRAAII